MPQSPHSSALAAAGGTNHIARAGAGGAGSGAAAGAGAAGAAGEAGEAGAGPVPLAPDLFLASDPTAQFIRDVTSVFKTASPTIAEDLGLEALLWAVLAAG